VQAAEIKANSILLGGERLKMDAGAAVTKEDLLNFEKRLDEKVDRLEERLKSELRQLEQRMAVKLGIILVAAAVLVVLQRWL
jgi:hypothetical protein